MQPLQPAQITHKSYESTRKAVIAAYDSGNPEFTKLASSREEFLEGLSELLADKPGNSFANETYHVIVRRVDENFLHLSIKRHDKQPIHDWRDLQAIKNQIAGTECEAVELYPAESRLVDSANQYHLWVVTDPTYRFPFGFTERFVTEEPLGNSQQRPFT